MIVGDFIVLGSALMVAKSADMMTVRDCGERIRNRRQISSYRYFLQWLGEIRR
jgi:hypothetical protein